MVAAVQAKVRVARYSIGIDIGGTFTDVTVEEIASGRRWDFKTPTVPRDPSAGVVNGLHLAERANIPIDQIDYFAHGTTIGLNTILQRDGAKVALLVTEGFRDVLEIARLRVPVPWNFHSRRPRPLIPRERVIAVPERISHLGAVERPLDAAGLERVVAEVGALAADGVAICLLHAYRNAQHERVLKQALQAAYPELYVVCSADVWPQMREYERAMVALMNAYIRPSMVRYLDVLEQVLRQQRVPSRPYLMRSNGGLMTLAAARDLPIHTVMSGPAAGVTGAAQIGQRAGFSDLITLDIGGTSADVGVVRGGVVMSSSEEHAGDFPLITPTIGISSIGAGGGSVAWLDGAGVLKIGPRSAGAQPGPACYDKGGIEPTLTDAFLTCGYLNAAGFAGRDTPLSVERAVEALAPLARALGLTVGDAAKAAVDVAVAMMYAELSGVFERNGLDPRAFTLLPFGGAGPVVGCMVAEQAHIRRLLVPPSPGTLCAWGALHADVMSDFIISVHCRDDADAQRKLHEARDALFATSETWLERDAPEVDAIVRTYTADMRYAGQSYEIDVPVPEGWELEHLINAFHRRHELVYRHSEPAAPVEITAVRLRVSATAAGSASEADRRQQPPASGEATKASGARSVAFDGGWVSAARYERASLRPGAVVVGPAIVEQPDSTCVIPPRWRARVDRFRNLVVELEAGGE